MKKKYILIDGMLSLLDMEEPEGTKDYTELINKPSINNVELSGNLTSSDIGVYEKPYSGIPASDLAKGVIPTEMVGSTGTNDGKSGLVPAPVAGNENRYLRGDGFWAEIGVGDVESISTETINNIFN